CPLQMVLDGVITTTTGNGITFTATCAEDEHPAEEPVTVYVVFACGLAVTFPPIELFSDADGLQEYVVAPEAISEALCPSQKTTLALGDMETTGNGITGTVTCADDEQPAEVPV